MEDLINNFQQKVSSAKCQPFFWTSMINFHFFSWMAIDITCDSLNLAPSVHAILLYLVNDWPLSYHDDVIKWKHFPRYWPFVRSPMNSPHKCQWCGALMFSLICVWINGWVNIRQAGDLRRYHAHYDAIVMFWHDCLYQNGRTSNPKSNIHVILTMKYLTTYNIRWERHLIFPSVESGLPYLIGHDRMI